ncbi:MAG: hypothetical protein NZ988_05730 [Thaumarchaeota archaeon]|nr:hypothetical protein [Candidatus Calditenuaceae archaeon]MDW8187522.1 hypothetical protein [Nitrososphaerota archaeon]
METVTFDQRRRIVIRRKPLEQSQESSTQTQGNPLAPSGPQEKEPPKEPQQSSQVLEAAQPGPLSPEAEELIRRAEEECRRAKVRYDDLLVKLEDLRMRDKSIQRVFVEKYPTPNLTVVKKKLSELEAARSRILAGAGETESSIQQAINELDSVISELEQVLFDKSVDLEYLYEAKSSGKGEGQGPIAELETECNRIRDAIARIMSLRSDLAQKLEVLRNLPNSIYKFTTYGDLAPEYLKKLKELKPLDESKLQHAIARVVQDEQVPREYAILYLYKKLVSQKPS